LTKAPDPASTSETSERKRKTGRTPELTVEVGRAIVGAIAAGNFPAVACGLAEVSIVTLERWLKRGDRGKQPYADFAKAYRQAELEGESAMVEIWKNAAPGDWRGAKEFLAKRHPERWSDHAARVAVLGREGTRFAIGGFQVIIHAFDEKKWEEQVRQRRLMEIPAVSVDDAIEIESTTPSTKV